jgi:hypothetical protein
MVEAKLFRVPRGGKPEEVTLFQVNVEINLSRNPKISGMFTDAQAVKEINAFFKKHDIGVANKFGDGTTVTRVELRGSPDGLAKFVETYLADDNSSVVYNLEYR